MPLLRGLRKRAARVLIIEADHEQQDRLRVSLAGDGYCVAPAWNAEMAIRMAISDAPEHILDNAGLPVFSGIHVAWRPGRAWILDRLPVLMATSEGLPSVVRLAQTLGIRVILQKSAVFAEVIASINVELQDWRAIRRVP